MPSIRFATIGAVLLAFLVAAVVVGVAHALVRRTLEALDIVGAENRAAVQARARQLTRALTLLAYGVAALAVLSLALNRFGVSEPQWDPRLLVRWFLTHGVNLVIIAAGAFIVVRAATLGIEHPRCTARVNGVAGTVEQINLRTVVRRDGDGAVQSFPNGTITALANLSKQFAYAVVDVRIAYSENIDRVMGTMREVGAAMEHDPVLGALVQAPLEIVGIVSLADGAATIRLNFKTHPLNQGKIANELRRRLMSAFVGRAIRPY